MYASLWKYRSDLAEDFTQRRPNNMRDSISFLKENGFWDNTCEFWVTEFQMCMGKMEELRARKNLMEHVVHNIRESANER